MTRSYRGGGLALALLWAAAGCTADPLATRLWVDERDAGRSTQDSRADLFPAPDLAPTALLITGAKPTHGPFTGGTRVVISGANFTSDVKVRFGGRAVQKTELVLLSPMALQVVAPAGSPGTVDVEVSNGSQSAMLPRGFTYDAAYLDPDTGPTVGGTLVTLRGQGTSFVAGARVELDGKPMTNVKVVSATLLRGRTPPGILGPARLQVSGGLPSGDLAVDGAYSYYRSSSPTYGGLGGGPVEGTLTVTVLDARSRTPVDAARVVLERERAKDALSYTDASGTAVFAGPQLRGPLTITAGKQDYRTTTIASFDARDVTIFLLETKTGSGGGGGPFPENGAIRGHILFGGPTGVGSPEWRLVPEPRPGQVKRAYVYSTVPYIEWPQPRAGAVIDYQRTGAVAWPYNIEVYTGLRAVYVLAGLYTRASGSFEPYAMGVARGVAVGPGETARADVYVNAPLTDQVKLRFSGLPPGPRRYQVKLAVDLGADGLVLRDDLVFRGEGLLGELSVGRLPRFAYQGLWDASYSIHLQLDAPTTWGLPLVRAKQLNVKPAAGVLLVDRLLAPPEKLSPAGGAVLAGNTFSWSSAGATPSLAELALEDAAGKPLWQVICNGQRTSVELPSPAAAGLPRWPSGTLTWKLYLAHLPAYEFNRFSYLHLYSHYWDRWSHDSTTFKAR